MALVTLIGVSLGQYGPDPEGLPADAKCGWRQLAHEYGAKLRPDADGELRAALDLDTFCRDRPRPAVDLGWQPSPIGKPAPTAHTLHVAPTGDDTAVERPGGVTCYQATNRSLRK